MSARAISGALAASAAAVVVAACGSTGGDEQQGAQMRAPTAAQQRTLAARVQQLVPNVSAEALGYTLRWGDPRADARALMDGERSEVWLFARRGDTPHRVAHDLAHELGHAYDQQRMSEAARREYLARRGRPDAPWWPAGDEHRYDAGAEDFAEVFALCHAASPEFRSRLAARPDAPCRLLPRAAAGDLTRRTTT